MYNYTGQCVFFPELVAIGDTNPNIEAALEFYENDLPSPHQGIVLRESFNGPILATERHFHFKKVTHVILYNIGHSIVIAVEKN